MSYQVLARKWRPKQFSELVGQEHVVRALSHALDGGRIHHAFLFLLVLQRERRRIDPVGSGARPGRRRTRWHLEAPRNHGGAHRDRVCASAQCAAVQTPAWTQLTSDSLLVPGAVVGRGTEYRD